MIPSNQNQPAFPCVPLQNNFGSFVVPIPGMTKLEYFSLIIYSGSVEQLKIETAIFLARQMLELLDKEQQQQIAESETTIIQ